MGKTADNQDRCSCDHGHRDHIIIDGEECRNDNTKNSLLCRGCPLKGLIQLSMDSNEKNLALFIRLNCSFNVPKTLS